MTISLTHHTHIIFTLQEVRQTDNSSELEIMGRKGNIRDSSNLHFKGENYLKAVTFLFFTIKSTIAFNSYLTDEGAAETPLILFLVCCVFLGLFFPHRRVICIPPPLFFLSRAMYQLPSGFFLFGLCVLEKEMEKLSQLEGDEILHEHLVSP